jgi:hypothetical protein
MTRLLFTTLLCALGTAQATAQTAVSQQLLELDDDERNAAFTLMLRDGHRKCDQVVGTLFRGTVLGVDEWEAMCRDRRSALAHPLTHLTHGIPTRRPFHPAKTATLELSDVKPPHVGPLSG